MTSKGHAQCPASGKDGLSLVRLVRQASRSQCEVPGVVHVVMLTAYDLLSLQAPAPVQASGNR